MPILLENGNWSILMQQIRNYLSNNWTELESMPRTWRNNQHIRMLITPINQKILCLCICVITVIQFFQFGNPSTKMLFHQFQQFLHHFLYILFFSKFRSILESITMNSIFDSVSLNIRHTKDVISLWLKTPTWILW